MTELWDILDENFNKTGRTVERGIPMKQDEYHLVVHVWIKNSKGEYLITKRTSNKPYPLMWETTGGSAITGDDSLSAALREVKEEIGINIPSGKGKVFLSLKRQHIDCPDFLDVWLFENIDIDINELTFHPEEVCDAMWVSPEQILKMIDEGVFVNVFDYLDELFNYSNSF